jgi:hypothetical protein
LAAFDGVDEAQLKALRDTVVSEIQALQLTHEQKLELKELIINAIATNARQTNGQIDKRTLYSIVANVVKDYRVKTAETRHQNILGKRRLTDRTSRAVVQR